MLEEAQQQVRQQPGPDLPLDGLLVVADEVGELERLLEFLEEAPLFFIFYTSVCRIVTFFTVYHLSC